MKLIRLFFTITVTTLLITTACEQTSNFGIDILPDGALLSTKTYNDEIIKSYTLEQDSVYIKNSAYNLLGSYVDPVFGKVKSEFAAQFRLVATNYLYPEDLNILSVELELQAFPSSAAPQNAYGNEQNPIKLKIYELAESLDPTADYFSTYKIEPSSLSKIYDGEINLPIVQKDSILRIKFDSDFINRFHELTSDTSTNKSNTVFLEAFKGLYFATEQVEDGGVIAAFDLLSANTALRIYYQEPSKSSDTLSFSVKVNSQSVRLNFFKNEASDELKQAISQKNSAELLYIQPMDGYYSVFEFPELVHWRDTLRDNPKLIIERANLMLTVATDPTRILFEAPSDIIAYSSDTAYIADYYDGSASYTIKLYADSIPTFNVELGSAITDYIHSNETEPFTFQLKAAKTSSQAHRLIIENKVTKPKLQISYSIVGE